MASQLERGRRFAALHDRPVPLLLPNPWDAGSARLLAHLGFEALGTTSLGLALALGAKRAALGDVLENARAIAQATPLPLSVDLENAFADAPEDVAKAVAKTAATGAVGASIEDATGEARRPIYDRTLAVERVAAAVEAARALDFPFLLTARAENVLLGVADLDEAIARLQAFEAVGADVLYAPGLRTLGEIRRVVAAVSKPVNVVMGFADPSITLEQLAEVEVGRVSIGGALSRVAHAAFIDAAREMRAGAFGFVSRAAPIAQLHAAFEGGSSDPGQATTASSETAR